MLSVFRDVSGAAPEWPWSSGFRRNSSSWVRISRMRLYPIELLGQLICYYTFYLLRDLSSMILLWFDSTWVLCRVVPGIFLIILLVKGCNISVISQSCHLKQLIAVNTELSFLAFNEKSERNKLQRTSFSQKHLT